MWYYVVSRSIPLRTTLGVLMEYLAPVPAFLLVALTILVMCFFNATLAVNEAKGRAIQPRRRFWAYTVLGGIIVTAAALVLVCLAIYTIK